MSKSFTGPPVTAHAVLRYLTRIERFNLRPLVNRLGRDVGNWTLAIAAAEQFGVPLAELQRRICPDRLAPVVRSGAGRIRCEGLTLICKTGLVVTVQRDADRRHVKHLSRREIKTGRQRQDRRR